MSLEPSPAPPVPIANSELRTLHSTIVGQDYLIKVRLPESYATTTTNYPVLYLLDGDHAFAMATDIVQYLVYGESIPDLIIISPAYGSKDAPEEGGMNMRDRDLLPYPVDWTTQTPGAAQYLQFFQQELIPYVESLYRIDSANRTLWGGSLGLLFVFFTLFHDPRLFRNYIALDGFHSALIDLEAQYASNNTTLPVRLSMVSGNGGKQKMSSFYETLKGRNYTGLQLDYAHFDLEHFLVPGAGLAKGLSMTFRT